MTAQEKAREKAIELYTKFRNENSVMSANVKAKKQALICTEEILGALYDNGIRETQGTRLFWYDVQTEIELL